VGNRLFPILRLDDPTALKQKAFTEREPFARPDEFSAVYPS
jgi:hypothetical protein